MAYISTAKPPHYQTLQGSYAPGFNTIYTVPGSLQATIVDIALSADTNCPAGISMSVPSGKILEVWGQAEPPAEINLSTLLTTGQSVTLTNSCPGTNGWYKIGFVEYDLYPTAPAGFTATTTLISTMGGFTYGEIITSTFSFVIMICIIFAMLYSWIFGSRIKGNSTI